MAADELTGTGASPPTHDRLVEWRAVGRGAAVSLVLLAAVSVAQAVVDHEMTDFDSSGWIYPFFVAVLVAYAVGGWVAGRSAPDAELTNGALGGLLGFVAWIPIRIVVWLVRDENEGLFTGHSPALRPGQLFGHLLIAAALGMLGGFLASRTNRRLATGAGGGSSAT